MGVWILTSEVSDYNQYGEYFEHIFFKHPSAEDLARVISMKKEYCQHFLDGKDRLDDGNISYNLEYYSDE